MKSRLLVKAVYELQLNYKSEEMYIKLHIN